MSTVLSTSNSAVATEPKRLWRRYLTNNPLFCWYFLLQTLGLRDFSPADDIAPEVAAEPAKTSRAA